MSNPNIHKLYVTIIGRLYTYTIDILHNWLKNKRTNKMAETSTTTKATSTFKQWFIAGRTFLYTISTLFVTNNWIPICNFSIICIYLFFFILFAYSYLLSWRQLRCLLFYHHGWVKWINYEFKLRWILH